MTFKSEVEKTNDKGFVGKTSTHLTFALPNPKSNVNLFALPFSVLTIDIQLIDKQLLKILKKLFHSLEKRDLKLESYKENEGKPLKKFILTERIRNNFEGPYRHLKYLTLHFWAMFILGVPLAKLFQKFCFIRRYFYLNFEVVPFELFVRYNRGSLKQGRFKW